MDYFLGDWFQMIAVMLVKRKQKLGEETKENIPLNKYFPLYI